MPRAIGIALGAVLLVAMWTTASGSDRVVWAALGLFVVALAVPILARKHPALRPWARGFQILCGLALLAAGLGLAGFGIVLFQAGSYGLLASFVVLPLSIAPLMFGWTLLKVGLAGEGSS